MLKLNGFFEPNTIPFNELFTVLFLLKKKTYLFLFKNLVILIVLPFHKAVIFTIYPKE